MKLSYHALLMAIAPTLTMHKCVAAASSPANTIAASTDQNGQASVPELSAEGKKRFLQGGSPTPAPTAVLSDEFDIKVESKATFKFDNDSTSEEMTATYLVGKDYLDRTVLSFLTVGDGDTCTNTDIIEGQMTASSAVKTRDMQNGTTVVAEFKIDLDLPKIVAETQIWEETDDSTGEILVCVRADVIQVLGTGVTGAENITLADGVCEDVPDWKNSEGNGCSSYTDSTLCEENGDEMTACCVCGGGLGYTSGVSVSFTETIYKVSLTYAQDFDTVNVTAVKLLAAQENSSADTAYGVNACQCDSSVSTACDSKDMNQNSVLDICVKLDAAADGVVIGAIKTLTLQQDSMYVPAISEQVENSLTEVDGTDSKNVVIKTRLISGFFTDASADNSITVTGTVIVKFMNPISDGRQLASLADLSRDLQANDGDVASQEDFSFDIELEVEVEASAPASGIDMSFVGNTVIVAAIVGIGGMM